MDEQNAYSHTVEYYSAKKKEWSTDICYNVEERQIYARWKEPGRKGFWDKLSHCYIACGVGEINNGYHLVLTYFVTEGFLEKQTHPRLFQIDDIWKYNVSWWKQESCGPEHGIVMERNTTDLTRIFEFFLDSNRVEKLVLHVAWSEGRLEFSCLKHKEYFFNNKFILLSNSTAQQNTLWLT